MIEKEIKQIIQEATNSEYIGKLHVTHQKMFNQIDGDLSDDLWTLLLYLDLEQAPMILGYQGTEEQFKNFIRNEMKARKLQLIKYWNTVREEPEEEEESWNEYEQI